MTFFGAEFSDRFLRAIPPVSRTALLYVLLVVALGVTPGTAMSAGRTALVVGNSSYKDAPSLQNPVNDASDIARVLEEQLGFEVILQTDVSRQQLETAVRDFRKRVQRHGGVALFFYAGHGVQVGGRNYLIPVDASIDSETDVRYKAVDAGYVLGQMDEADAALNIVILDACRDNPWKRSFRSATRGLARLDMPAGELGSLLAYSTAPGEVAADGEGRNSPYTAGLLSVLPTPGLTLEQVFKQVTIGVYEQTEQRQKPWTSQFLLGDFYFVAEQQETDDNPRQFALTVMVDPAGAVVQLVGSDRSYTSGMPLSPGSYRIRVSKAGYEPQEQVIRVADQDRNVQVVLRPVLQLATPKGPSPMPTIAQLQGRGLEPLSNTQLQNLHAGNTLYYESLLAGTVTPVFFSRTGAAMALFENGLIEGRYWISDGRLCVENIPPEDLCVPVFRDGETYRACDPREEGLCGWAINRTEPGDAEGLRRPTESQLRGRGLVQLSDTELLELIAGNTVYLEDSENYSVLPIYHLESGRRRLMFEERFFEGSYWVSNDELCVESVFGGDLCTPIFKDGDVYRMCHPNPDFACRWFFRRIEAGNRKDLRPD